MIYGLQDLHRFLAARDLGAPTAELCELKMAAQMSWARARDIDGRNSAAMLHRDRHDHGVSSLVAARIVARELLLDHARYAARTAMTEDEYRAALRLRDRALGRNGE
jgi:hypothetical protein